MSYRKALSWQPILGGGFRMTWDEIMDLSPSEIEDLWTFHDETRGAELRAFAKMFSGRR